MGDQKISEITVVKILILYLYLNKEQIDDLIKFAYFSVGFGLKVQLYIQ